MVFTLRLLFLNASITVKLSKHSEFFFPSILGCHRIFLDKFVFLLVSFRILLFGFSCGIVIRYKKRCEMWLFYTVFEKKQ